MGVGGWRLAMVVAAGLVALPGCAEGEGIVEVYWQFEDAQLRRIYPPGDRFDTCDFTSGSGVTYDLRVRLSVIENTDACASQSDDPACQIIEPLLFPCNRFRGTANPVPVSAGADGTDPGYLMFVEAVIVPEGGEPFVPNPDCLLGPGPRVRKVRPGRATDLEVWQFIVSAVTTENYALDIDGCR
jgi:hypothetical protein